MFYLLSLAICFALKEILGCPVLLLFNHSYIPAYLINLNAKRGRAVCAIASHFLRIKTIKLQKIKKRLENTIVSSSC